MIASRTTARYILLGLLLLSVIPTVAGVVRLVQLGGILDAPPESARFFANPVPVILHILGSTVFSVIGAFQLTPNRASRLSNPHRIAGLAFVFCGMVTAITGLWMTIVYPAPPFDGFILSALRLVVGTAMAVCLGLGVIFILRRQVASHSAWMMRGYALGMGAGTQVFTHIPWALLPDWRGEQSRTLMMAAGWVVNLLLAEWLIRGSRTRKHMEKRLSEQNALSR